MINKQWNRKLSLRNRIFLSMIFLTIISSALIAAVSLLQYRSENKVYQTKKFNDHETEILKHINYALSTTSFPIITENIPFIFKDKIHEISNIHNVQINFYNLNGELIKTSTSNFAVDSVSTKLSADLLRLINKSSEKKYSERIRINNKNYLNSYTEIVNEKFKPIAIMNLPYPEDDKIFRDEIGLFLIKMLQVYVFILFVSIFLAYYLSNYITNSLKLISEKINEIQLNKKNEKIYLDIKSKEINLLIDAYNDMVDQLEASAQKLAQSEREGAWREMAKQIAHEVKNPLTPMRLTIQNFERKFDATDPNIKEKLHQYTITLLEQIDTMSAVASTFSNFASIPVQNNELLNLTEVAQNTIDVFDNKKVRLITPNQVIQLVFDRSLLVRILTNLIKNAVQACKEVDVPKVEVVLEQHQNHALIRVLDNGIGIPEAIKDRIFEPKFTTKSSGMGLGLAIIKNIVESYQGTVHFESKPFESTEFVVTLPLKNN